MGKIAAVVLAAGQGKRMNCDIHKQYLRIKDKPVLYYSLQMLEQSEVDSIILVTGREEIAYCEREIVGKYGFAKVENIIGGGKERYHSVYEGLKALPDDTEYVLIHDGARPLLTERIIRDTVEAVKIYKACAVGMPVKDTIKLTDENRFALKTPDRARMWAVQTPQAFAYDLIWRAYSALMKKEIPVTDDAMVVEAFLQHPVKLVEGSYRNIKITTPEDLLLAEVLLKEEAALFDAGGKSPRL